MKNLQAKRNMDSSHDFPVLGSIQISVEEVRKLLHSL